MPAVEFEVWCSECGEGICNNMTLKSTKYGTVTFTCEPCEKCLDKAREDGVEKGRDEKLQELDVAKARIEELESELGRILFDSREGNT